MTPEQIEYVRQWAASGNEPRFTIDVDDLPEELWQTLEEDKYSTCKLSQLGLTIAAQAERIRELEHTATELQAAFEHVHAEALKLELMADRISAKLERLMK